MSRRFDVHLLVALVVFGVGLGFAAGMAVGFAGAARLQSELEEFRGHQHEVSRWLDFLDHERPRLSSVAKRGLAEMSADVYWPRPGEEGRR